MHCKKPPKTPENAQCAQIVRKCAVCVGVCKNVFWGYVFFYRHVQGSKRFYRITELIESMRILIFTEGTILIHRSWVGVSREEIVKQVKSGGGPWQNDFAGSVPKGNCVKKIAAWKEQGAVILYLTSRRKTEEIQAIRNVLEEYNFPEGELFFRRAGEEYKDVAERALPDVIIEDDCESIGGEKEMTYPHIKQELKGKIKSIVVKEFGGIDHLPDKISDLLKY